VIVVGVDFSLASTGLVRSTGEVKRIRTTGKTDDDLIARHERLLRICANVKNELGAADLVVLEGPSFASVGGHHHDRSGGWWLLVDALRDYGVPIAVAPPKSLKKYATGKGNAGKDLVLAETVRRYPNWTVDGNDVADALVLCAMGVEHLGMEPLAALPELHRVALPGVAWPVLS
jgi:crossover junction endodeoxyribonuclease RuvC